MKKAAVLFICLALSWALCVSETLAQKYDLKIMTGPMGGAWYPLGGAIADAIQKKIPGVTLSRHARRGDRKRGGSGNRQMRHRLFQFLFRRGWLYGRPPFKKKMENMRQLANLYPQYFQMVVAEDSGIKSVPT